jgi:hypothetical protein
MKTLTLAFAVSFFVTGVALAQKPNTPPDQATAQSKAKSIESGGKTNKH